MNGRIHTLSGKNKKYDGKKSFTKKYDDMLEFIKLRKKIVGVLFVIFVPVVRNKTWLLCYVTPAQ